MKQIITNIDLDVNNRLKEIRQILDLSQQEFSKILEVKQSYYSDVENGKREVTSKLVKNLVNIFNFSADWIFTGSGNHYITKVDKSSNNSETWNVHKSINAGAQTNIYKDNSEIPFYLDLHIDKKLILDMIKLDTDAGKLYEYVNNITAFSFIIEALDRQYFNNIKVAEKNRNRFYNDSKFDYEAFLNNVILEVDKIMKFKPALENVNKAIEAFYSEIKGIDDQKVIDGFFGRVS